jgi:quercetin dioxygenase-like cupin family protein
MSGSLTRRDFLETAGAAAVAVSGGSLGLLAASCAPAAEQEVATSGPESRPADSVSQPIRWRGAVLQRNEGELLIAGRRKAPMRVKVDSTIAVGATMSMIVSEVAPGAVIPVHLHRNEDELIFIHTGTGMVTLGDERIAVSPGAVLYGPRNIWHGVENTGSSTLTWCAIYSPPGFEQFFRETGVRPGGNESPAPPERVAAIARKYGMIFRDA